MYVMEEIRTFYVSIFYDWIIGFIEKSRVYIKKCRVSNVLDNNYF